VAGGFSFAPPSLPSDSKTLLEMITALWRSLSDWVARKLPLSLQDEAKSLEVASAEATKAFEEIHRVTNERLGQALRIQQALARGAPEAEVQALQQKYREASEQGNADLKPFLELLSDPEAGAALLPDDPFCQGQLTKAALVPQLRRRRRLKRAGTLLTGLAFLPLPELLLSLC
jgi:hypothetical protein